MIIMNHCPIRLIWGLSTHWMHRNKSEPRTIHRGPNIDGCFDWIRIRGIRRPVWHLEFFTSFLRPFLGSVCSATGALSSAGRPLLSRSTVAMRGWNWSATVFGWVAFVKEASTENDRTQGSCGGSAPLFGSSWSSRWFTLSVHHLQDEKEEQR